MTKKDLRIKPNKLSKFIYELTYPRKKQAVDPLPLCLLSSCHCETNVCEQTIIRQLEILKRERKKCWHNFSHEQQQQQQMKRCCGQTNQRMGNDLAFSLFARRQFPYTSRVEMNGHARPWRKCRRAT